MSQLTMIALDLVAIGLLTFALYFARHHRRDLLVAYLIVNVGVMAVTVMLADSAVGVGLGLGLFGVLSIIRLRSSEIAQHEVVYYFASLALGLIAGLGAADLASTATSTLATLVAPALMALILLVIAFGDHPRLFRAYSQQTVTLDAAIADELTLRARLEGLLGARARIAADASGSQVSGSGIRPPRVACRASTSPPLHSSTSGAVGRFGPRRLTKTKRRAAWAARRRLSLPRRA